MKFRTRQLFLLVFLMVGSGALSVQAISESSGNEKARITKEFVVEKGAALVMKRVTGHISITGWDKQKVEIVEDVDINAFTDAEKQRITEKMNTNYHQRDGDIIISGQRRGHIQNHRYTIFVPQQFDLDIRNDNGSIFIENIKGDMDLSSRNGGLRLTGCTGSVYLKTSAGNLVLKDVQGDFDGKTSGGNITIQNGTGTFSLTTSGGNISATRISNRINLKTSGGWLEINEIDGDLKAHTSGGSIRAYDGNGKFRLSTSGGSIDLQRLSGVLRASTSGGSIQGSQFEGEVDLKTSGGDIKLKKLAAVLDGKTHGGDITVDVTLEDFTKPHGINLFTFGGDIVVNLPVDLPAYISARIATHTRRSYQRFDIYSDFPLTKQASEDAESERYIVAEGKINGGGDDIILRTDRGNIYIKMKK